MLRLPWAVVVSVLLAAASASSSSSPSSSSSSTDQNQANATSVDVTLLFSTPEGRRGLDDMELAPLTATCVACVMGVVVCFAGARLLKSVALGCAFFDGAFGTAAVLAHVLDHAVWDGVVSWSCFFLGGIFACLLVVSMARGAVLCVGITAGLLTACTSLTTFGYLLAPSQPERVLYGLLAVFGVLCGWLTLKTQPLGVIPATSWIGSNMATWGLGYFFGDYPNATSITKFRRASNGEYELPSAWWAYLAGTLALFLLGICVQTHTFPWNTKPPQRLRETVVQRPYASGQTPPPPRRPTTQSVHHIV